MTTVGTPAFGPGQKLAISRSSPMSLALRRSGTCPQVPLLNVMEPDGYVLSGRPIE
jgi:hypothetical protein